MPENTKKFLWLAAAVSLFALLVVGAAFLLFAPTKTTGQAPFDLKGKAESKQESPQDFLANAPVESGTTQTTSPSGDIIIVYGNNTDGKTSAAPAETKQKPSTTTIVVAPPATTATAITTTTVKQVEAPKASQIAPAAKTVVQPAAKAPAVTAKPKPAPAAAPVKSPAPKAEAGDYWIQAGSFSVKDNADALKSSFKDKGLPTAVTVKDTDGKSRYLVKIGPYPSREEANKWLSAVKSVKGAEKAWITQ